MQALLEAELRSGRDPRSLHTQPKGLEHGKRDGDWTASSGQAAAEENDLSLAKPRHESAYDFEQELARELASLDDDPTSDLDEDDDIIAMAEADRMSESKSSVSHAQELNISVEGMNAEVGHEGGTESGSDSEWDDEELEAAAGQGAGMGSRETDMDPDVLAEFKQRAIDGGMSPEEADAMYAADGDGEGAAYELDFSDDELQELESHSGDFGRVPDGGTRDNTRVSSRRIEVGNPQGRQ